MNKPILFFLAGATGCKPDMDPEEIPATEGAVEYPELTTVDAAITEIMSEDGVPGVSTCIVKDGQTAWCSGYGYANLSSELVVTPSTPFMLASVSKTITGVALMHVVETGAIGLDDPINDHLGFAVVHPEDDTPITARMLLSHTSGIDDNWNVLGSLVVDGDSPVALGDFMEGYLTPGGQWYNSSKNFLSAGVKAQNEYSNVGAALAGYLVEAVTEQDFADYCDENIFAPLQMTDTAWHLADLDEDSIAVPYDGDGSDWSAVEHYGYPDYPDGALRSGAEPIARFLTMFASGGTLDGTTILAADTVEEMQTVHYPSLNENQGLIWYSWQFNGETITGHNGGDYGVSTEIGISNDGVGFVVLMNGEGKYNTLSDIEEVLMEAAAEL